MQKTGAAFLISVLLLVITGTISSQTIDTIANWDGIEVNWTVANATGQVVTNPEQGGINPSANCMEITTSENAYDLMYTDFDNPVNFVDFPNYRLKILAPASGGTVMLKFENSGLTSWHEIEMTPEPGEWDDLEFDFSEVTANDYIRMVIFFDFLGTEAGNQWYVDDVIRVSDETPGLTSNLPIVIINTNGVEIPDEPKIDGTMGIIDNGPGTLNNQSDPPNEYSGNIGIEIRGQSTQMYPKKSYAFETRDSEGENLDVSILGMPEENDWILYGPYSDKSMLRNFISFYMGSKLSTYCSRMAYCEVIVNDDYRGVYILMEKIKKDENRVNIAKLKPEDTSGDEVTGGYILRVDKLDYDFEFGVDGWESVPIPAYPDAMHIIFQYFYPRPDEIMPQQRNYIKSYITITENSLTRPTFTDKDNGYNKYINTGSFVDHMILCEISKEVDKYRYSTYFYKEKNSDGGKLFAGPAWDFNFGFSNVNYWAPGNDYTGWLYSMVEPVDWSIMFWWKRLNEDPYFRDLFKTRWTALRANELTNANLEQALDSVISYIYEAQERNYERWPILGEYVYPNLDWQGNDYDDEVAYFKTWLFNRLGWIDSHVPGNMLFPYAELSGNYPELELTLGDDFFSRQILKNKYFTLNGAPAGIDIDTVLYVNASQAVIILEGDAGTETLELSVTLDSKILNSFDDITTNTYQVGVGSLPGNQPEFTISSAQNSIFISCKNPEYLGHEMEIFNISGQRVALEKLAKSGNNSINLPLGPGVYICRFGYDGKMYSRRIVISY